MLLVIEDLLLLYNCLNINIELQISLTYILG